MFEHQKDSMNYITISEKFTILSNYTPKQKGAKIKNLNTTEEKIKKVKLSALVSTKKFSLNY